MVHYLISVFLLFSLLFQACGEAVESSVPPSPIYYNLFLQDARHRALLSPGGIVRITEPSTVQERIGRAGEHILCLRPAVSGRDKRDRITDGRKLKACMPPLSKCLRSSPRDRTT